MQPPLGGLDPRLETVAFPSSLPVAVTKLSSTMSRSGWVMRRVVKPAPAAANPPVVVPAPKMSSCPVVVVTAPLFAELLMPDADAPTSKGLYRMARAGSEANLDRGPHDPRQDIEPRQPLPARLFVQAAWVVLVKVKPNIQRDRATLGLGRMGHAGCDLQGGQLKRGGRPTYKDRLLHAACCSADVSRLAGTREGNRVEPASSRCAL